MLVGCLLVRLPADLPRAITHWLDASESIWHARGGPAAAAGGGGSGATAGGRCGCGSAECVEGSECSLLDWALLMETHSHPCVWALPVHTGYP